jgi:hypothetical protein
MLSSPGRRTRAEIAASIAVVESPISAAVTSVTLTSSVKMRKLSSGNKQKSVTFYFLFYAGIDLFFVIFNLADFELIVNLFVSILSRRFHLSIMVILV